MEHKSIEFLLVKQLPELVSSSEYSQRSADANGANRMNRDRSACKFAAQPSLEAQSKLLLQFWKMLAAADERGQYRLHTTVKIPAMNMKQAHQFSPRASLR
jgi:hypothetical protein